VADNARIEELRRRVQRDKASIAFAQLAEEYRRAGRFAEAIGTCRTGLAHHPGYLSAHVTLGRALIETGELELAQDELTRVHAAAPENLAAIKGLAEIHHRRGERREALALSTRALQLVPHDPELEHLVSVIAQEMTADAAPSVDVPPVAAAPAPAPAADLAVAEAVEAGRLHTAPVSASDSPAQPDSDTPGPRTLQQVEALERWLDAILADRDNRP
jgi:tetratricopeptide (TPR) repeat protein